MNDFLVYDVGMNNGDDTAYYLHCGHRVLGIEADPHLCAQAERRFSGEIAAGRLEVLPVAIGPTDGVISFWICEEDRGKSSCHLAEAGKKGRHVTAVDVPCRQLRSVFQSHGLPHFLKIDIEGYERVCLETLDGDHLPEYISVQMNGIDELLELRRLGYDTFKLVQQEHLIELPDETRAWGAFSRYHLDQ